MGTEEVILYFDLCRELIRAGWNWCFDNSSTQSDGEGLSRKKLTGHLQEVRDIWMAEPFVDSTPPEFMIECSRRRVPCLLDVPIEGLEEQQPSEHPGDCECPICCMMADGMLGPAVKQLDGYHLEFDDDFAFSLAATPEEWQEQHEMNEQWELEMENMDMAVSSESTETSDPEDEFASVWSGAVSEEPLPGDHEGVVKLGFLLSELISQLSLSSSKKEEFSELVARFNEFFKSAPEMLDESGKELANYLESLTEPFPDLVPRIADLQSRIQENIRWRKRVPDGDPPPITNESRIRSGFFAVAIQAVCLSPFVEPSSSGMELLSFY